MILFKSPNRAKLAVNEDVRVAELKEEDIRLHEGGGFVVVTPERII